MIKSFYPLFGQNVPHWNVNQVAKSLSYISEPQDGTQAVNNIFSQVRVFRVPHQADGDDLWGIHQYTSNTELLSTVALYKRKRELYSFQHIMKSMIVIHCSLLNFVEIISYPRQRPDLTQKQTCGFCIKWLSSSGPWDKLTFYWLFPVWPSDYSMTTSLFKPRQAPQTHTSANSHRRHYV